MRERAPRSGLAHQARRACKSGDWLRSTRACRRRGHHRSQARECPGYASTGLLLQIVTIIQIKYGEMLTLYEYTGIEVYTVNTYDERCGCSPWQPLQFIFPVSSRHMIHGRHYGVRNHHPPRGHCRATLALEVPHKLCTRVGANGMHLLRHW